jgi:hypothetical protein
MVYVEDYLNLIKADKNTKNERIKLLKLALSNHNPNLI